MFPINREHAVHNSTSRTSTIKSNKLLKVTDSSESRVVLKLLLRWSDSNVFFSWIFGEMYCEQYSMFFLTLIAVTLFLPWYFGSIDLLRQSCTLLGMVICESKCVLFCVKVQANDRKVKGISTCNYHTPDGTYVVLIANISDV